MQKYKMRLCDRAALIGLKTGLAQLEQVTKDIQKRETEENGIGPFIFGYFKATESHIEWLSGFIKSYENMFQEEKT